MRIEGIIKKKIGRLQGTGKNGMPYDFQQVLVEADETYTKRDGTVNCIKHEFIISCTVKNGLFGFEEGQKMYFEVYFSANQYGTDYFQRCNSRFYYALNN